MSVGITSALPERDCKGGRRRAEAAKYGGREEKLRGFRRKTTVAQPGRQKATRRFSTAYRTNSAVEWTFNSRIMSYLMVSTVRGERFRFAAISFIR